MAAGFSEATIAAVRNLSGRNATVLEWKPRVIGLVLLLILIGVVTGVLVPDDPGPLNWEW
jgi:hypothetical protein